MTASALAEHAYCPRALYYHRTTDPASIEPDVRDRLMRGERIHREYGRTEARREARGRAVLLLVAGLTVALAVLVFYGVSS